MIINILTLSSHPNVINADIYQGQELQQLLLKPLSYHQISSPNENSYNEPPYSDNYDSYNNLEKDYSDSYEEKENYYDETYPEESYDETYPEDNNEELENENEFPDADMSLENEAEDKEEKEDEFIKGILELPKKIKSPSSSTPTTTPLTEVCRDNVDNDNDGQMDEKDCKESPSSSTPTTTPLTEVCRDNVDNDNDGQMDEKDCKESPSSSTPTTTQIHSASCGEVVDSNIILTSDLICSSDGILIGNNNLVIDLNGNTIIGPGTSSSKVGIVTSNHDNIIVKGPGLITNFQTGILVTGTNDMLVDSVDLEKNEVAILTSGSSNISVEENKIEENTIGFTGYSSTSLVIKNNLVLNNELVGISLLNVQDSNIILNNVQNSMKGVFLDNQSHNIKISLNNAFFNTQDIENSNGLPPNVNNNIFNGNNCQYSSPSGICYILPISSEILTPANPLTTPGKETPGQPLTTTPGEQTPGEQTPGKETPGQPLTTTPGKETPGEQTPGKETPGKETPGQPLTTTPGEQIPGKETPGKETPGKETILDKIQQREKEQQQKEQELQQKEQELQQQRQEEKSEQPNQSERNEYPDESQNSKSPYEDKEYESSPYEDKEYESPEYDYT
ncbi:MAG TPA: right-handed parallel beta-helix repeat-containing protein [Nitrososphaeraceae archaeon]|nr:right-handed parallel beta-helix repeat-containing protein [Nitrososphaeraceae archaeon]